MADEENTAPEGVDEAGSATDTDQHDDTSQLGEGGHKALAAERKARTTAERQAKAAQTRLDELSAKLQQIEDRDKTETQKLTDRATAAEQAAATAQTELLRYRVAADKKLPASLASRLNGATEEEMAADADALLEVLGSQQPKAPSFDGGVRQAARPSDMNSLIRQTAGRG